MAEEDKNKNLENTETEENVEDTVENQDNKNTSKTFNQSEVNTLIGRERKKWGKEKTDLESQLESVRTELEDLQKSLIDARSKNLTDKEKKLLAKLSYADALEYLSEVEDVEDNTSKKVTPKTPQNSKVENNQPVKPVNKFRI